MSKVTGQGTALQIGKESSWGTAVAPSVALNYTSEGFKPVLTYKEEETLVGSTTSTDMDILKKSVTFDGSLLAKPENIGLLMALALGDEGTATAVTGSTGLYTHAFTPKANALNSSFPSFTAILDRKVAKKAYTGCKIGGLSISCAKEGYMNITFSGVGKNEEDGTSKYSSALTVPALKAFRFMGSTVTFDGSEFGDITDINWSIDNALDEGEQTTGSGVYGTEPEPQKRSISFSLSALYNSSSETIRNNKYLTGSTAAVVLNFESPSEAISGKKYKLQVSMPLCVITDGNPNITGKETVTLTLAGTALESSSSAAVTVTLTDKKNTKYSA